MNILMLTSTPLPWTRAPDLSRSNGIVLSRSTARSSVKGGRLEGSKYGAQIGGIHTKLLRQPQRGLLCSNNLAASGGDETLTPDDQPENKGFWRKWKANSKELSAKVAKLGLAAVLAYGLFDAVTYTSFFVLAFLGYEKSTGKNPAANLQALLGIVILMWTGNNVTRPFRVAGAAALAPAIDKGLKEIQKYFKFPNLVYAFALIVSLVAGTCFTIAGLLILSRWGK